MTTALLAQPAAVDEPASSTERPSLDRRLRLIEGQVRGLRRMLNDERHSEEVLIQLLATSRALDAIRLRVLSAHLCTDTFVDDGPTPARRRATVERLLRTMR